ncbi:MAG TPA: hypothetical protein PK636_04470 [bacterium]|nr:hypothetical protein [bacterium]HPJ71919.1 hypothetical protein [bacterium]HPQ67190.1 hypothetical protein [bacterium]
MKKTAWLLPGAALLLLCGCGGARKEKRIDAEIERVGALSGVLEVAVPGGDAFTVEKESDILFLQPGAVVRVTEGECTGYLGKSRVRLSSGQSAKIIAPLTVIDDIMSRSGGFRARRPDGSEVEVGEADELPLLPAQTVIMVTGGTVMVSSEGMRIALAPGEMGILGRGLSAPGEIGIEEIEAANAVQAGPSATPAPLPGFASTPELGPASPYFPE